MRVPTKCHLGAVFRNGSAIMVAPLTTSLGPYPENGRKISRWPLRRQDRKLRKPLQSGHRNKFADYGPEIPGEPSGPCLSPIQKIRKSLMSACCGPKRLETTEAIANRPYVPFALNANRDRLVVGTFTLTAFMHSYIYLSALDHLRRFTQKSMKRAPMSP